MSDQAGDAAKLRKETKDKMEALGEHMREFAKCLLEPSDRYCFVVDDISVTVGIRGENPGKPPARLTQVETEWAGLCKMLRDYEDHVTELKRNPL
jgi:hypothetical protein